MKKLLLGLFIVALLVPVYMSINPALSPYLPKCIFHVLTGYNCPACGIQRAFHALLQGDFMGAISYNYFLVIAIPYFIAVAVTTFCKGKYINVVGYYVQHHITTKIAFVLIVMWWIVRNILLI